MVAPSYVEKDGCSGVYEWIVPHTVALAPMPKWLLRLIIASAQTRRTTYVEPRHPEGRNNRLFQLGRSLHWQRGARLRSQIADTLRRENLLTCHPPLPEAEVRKIIQSALTLPDRPDWASTLPRDEHAGRATPTKVNPNTL